VVLRTADGDIEELRAVVVWSLGIEPPTGSRLSQAIRYVDDHHLLFITLVAMHGARIDRVAEPEVGYQALQ
jgi:hypothetical protein